MDNKTNKLYYVNSRESGFSAVVTGCNEHPGGFNLTLDRTLFYPEGGGQPCDTGYISDAKVTAVYEKDGVVYHIADRAVAPGTAVDCKIDWERRFAFMQGHTGEHLVSGILLRRGLNNVGFHMGTDFTTIDVDGPISLAELDEVERLANRAVYENIPVTAAFPDTGVLQTRPFRCKLPAERLIGGEIRIVSIPGYDDCACCGVHCSATGEVGLVKLLDAHAYKGGTRIYMLCGGKALADYNKKNKDIYALSALLSAKPLETAAAVTALRQDNGNLKAALANAKNRLFQLLVQGIPDDTKIFVHFEDDLSPDELRRLATLAADKAGTAVIFSGDGDAFKYAVASKTGDAKTLAARMNESLGGKGGGSPALAQGTVTAGETEIRIYWESR